MNYKLIYYQWRYGYVRNKLKEFQKRRKKDDGCA